MMNPFKNVEVNKPPKITVAIGLWISFPGRSPFNANGINAKAELNAEKVGLQMAGLFDQAEANNAPQKTHHAPA